VLDCSTPYPFVASCELLHLGDVPSWKSRVLSASIPASISALCLTMARDLDADRGTELNTTTTVVLVLSAVFVGLRFWARQMRIGYGNDDWLTLASLVGSIQRSQDLYNLTIS
jgi:hypothetical protein